MGGVEAYETPDGAVRETRGHFVEKEEFVKSDQEQSDAAVGVEGGEALHQMQTGRSGTVSLLGRNQPEIYIFNSMKMSALREARPGEWRLVEGDERVFFEAAESMESLPGVAFFCRMRRCSRRYGPSSAFLLDQSMRDVRPEPIKYRRSQYGVWWRASHPGSPSARSRWLSECHSCVATYLRWAGLGDVRFAAEGQREPRWQRMKSIGRCMNGVLSRGRAQVERGDLS